MNNNVLETMFPTEIYYEILNRMNGFERENVRLVCKLFYLYNPTITTDNPERDLEVRLFIYPDSIYKLLDYGHENVVITYIRNHPDKIYPNVIANYLHIHTIFNLACNNGSLRVVKALIREIDYLDMAIYHAALGGHIHIIKYIFGYKRYDITKCPKIRMYNMGLYGACESDNMDLIKYMLAIGANDLDGCIEMCGGTNRLDIQQYLIDYKNSFNKMRLY